MRTLFLITFLIYFTDGQYRFDYEYHKEVGGWLKLHRVPAKWKDARLRCFNEGGVLASPENNMITTAMVQMTASLDASCGIYTGISSIYSQGDYFTVEGTPLSRIRVQWAPGEPDNYEDNEGCLLMLSNGTVGDVKCSEVYPYVCFKKENEYPAMNECGTLDKEYKLDARTGSCYKFHSLPLTWPRAFSACSGEGGYLAVVNSETEAKVLAEIFSRYPNEVLPGNFIKHVMHIGYSTWQDGQLMSIHGQTLKDAGFDKWSNGQPANATYGEYCGAFHRNGLLDDVWCDRPCPYICEKKPTSLLEVV